MGPTQAASGSQGRAQNISVEGSLRARIWMVRPHLAAPPAEIPGVDSRSGSGVSEGRADAARLLPPDCFAQCCGVAAIGGHTGTATMDAVSDVEPVAEPVLTLIVLNYMIDAIPGMPGAYPFVVLQDAVRNSPKYFQLAGIVNVSHPGQCGVRVAGSQHCRNRADLGLPAISAEADLCRATLRVSQRAVNAPG